ncbi:excisionase [Clostridium sp. CAG:352]|nr:excisionase [Clostridium sp. CAG:352]SCI90246.1 DNA binding domain%2C excisionase family [uncultured Ruminococcus sp.]
MENKIISVPTHLKILLTVKETSELFNIGENKIKELTNDNDCKFVLWNGSKRLIKRKAFEDYLLRQYSI